MEPNKLIVLEQEQESGRVIFYGFVGDEEVKRYIAENIGDVDVYRVIDSRAYSYQSCGKTFWRTDGTTIRKDHVKVTVAAYREKNSAPAA